jgi:hypothetical protein
MLAFNVIAQATNNFNISATYMNASFRKLLFHPQMVKLGNF